MKSIQNTSIVNADFVERLCEMGGIKNSDVLSITIQNPNGGNGVLGKYGVISEMKARLNMPEPIYIFFSFSNFNPDYVLETSFRITNDNYKTFENTSIKSNDVSTVVEFVTRAIDELETESDL